MPTYEPYTEVSTLEANSQGQRAILEAHLDQNHANLADGLERLSQALFTAGGVVIAGAVTNPTGAQVKVVGRLGVSSDGKTLLAVGDQTVDLAEIATGTKCLVVIRAQAGATVELNFTDATTSESLTHTLMTHWGLLAVLEGDSSDYPELPADCVPVAQVTKTGASTLSLDSVITTAPSLRYTSEGGESLVTQEVEQASHGFSVGDVIRHNGTSFAQATADTAANAAAVGVVTAVADTDNFTFQTAGVVTGLTGLTAGAGYYLQDDGTLGTTAGTVTKPILIAVSATAAVLLLAIGASSSGGGGGGGAALTNWINVQDSTYGAVGDNSTDDTSAIQAAATAADGDVLFIPPGRYKLTGSITIDPAKVRAVIAHGAYFRTTTSDPAIIVDGGLTSGTATPPNSNTNSIKATEMMPRIVGLTIYSTESPFAGIGIRVTQTFGIIIEGVNLFNLETGIEFTSHNRNVIVRGSHIWDVTDYGIHFNDVNQHQTIIADNHISYAERVIFFDEGDVHNIQIVGNDLETGETQGSVIYFDAQDTDSQHSQIQISGNSIEGHLNNTEALITFARGTGIIGTIEVTGNEFSGSSEPALEIIGASNMAITGNNFRSIDDYAILLTTKANFITIVGNAFSAPEESTRFMGVLKAALTSESGGIKLDSNTATTMMCNPIEIGVTGALLYETSINNNILHMAATRGSGAPDITSGYMLDINSNDDLAGISVRGNQLRSRDYCGHGIRVAGDTYAAVRVLDNDIRGLPAGKTAFTLPSPAADVIVGEPYDMQLGFAGTLDASATDTLLVPRAVIIGDGDEGEVFVGTNPTDGTATIDVQKNGSSVGSVSITTGGVGSFTFSSDVTLAAGDRLSLVAPSTPDSTLADVLVAFKGVAR